VILVTFLLPGAHERRQDHEIRAAVCVESEGLAPVAGGYTSASTVWVENNGTTYCVAIGRTTVSTGTVSYAPPYFC
jgi:hypothetical protein